MTPTPEQLIAQTIGGDYAVSHARRILTRLDQAGYRVALKVPDTSVDQIPLTDTKLWANL